MAILLLGVLAGFFFIVSLVLLVAWLAGRRDNNYLRDTITQAILEVDRLTDISDRIASGEDLDEYAEMIDQEDESDLFLNLCSICATMVRWRPFVPDLAQAWDGAGDSCEDGGGGEEKRQIDTAEIISFTSRPDLGDLEQFSLYGPGELSKVLSFGPPRPSGGSVPLESAEHHLPVFRSPSGFSNVSGRLLMSDARAQSMHRLQDKGHVGESEADGREPTVPSDALLSASVAGQGSCGSSISQNTHQKPQLSGSGSGRTTDRSLNATNTDLTASIFSVKRMPHSVQSGGSLEQQLQPPGSSLIDGHPGSGSIQELARPTQTAAAVLLPSSRSARVPTLGRKSGNAVHASQVGPSGTPSLNKSSTVLSPPIRSPPGRGGAPSTTEMRIGGILSSPRSGRRVQASRPSPLPRPSVLGSSCASALHRGSVLGASGQNLTHGKQYAHGRQSPRNVTAAYDNLLRLRKGTVLHLSGGLDLCARPDGRAQTSVPETADMVERHEGCIVLLAEDLVVAWNVAKPVTFHAQRGAQCAISMSNLNQRNSLIRGSGLSSGAMYVGLAGTNARASLVAAGLPLQNGRLLASLCHIIKAAVLCDEQCHAGTSAVVPSRVVDAVNWNRENVHQRPTLVYELSVEAVPEHGHVQGVGALLTMLYDEAIGHFCKQLQEVPGDIQSRRLLLLAIHLSTRVATDGAIMYARDWLGWESWDTSSTDDASMPASVRQVLTNSVPLSPASGPNRITSTAQQSEAVLLRLRIDEIRRERKKQQRQSIGQNSERPGLPPAFVDQRRREWYRSDQVLGKGAFGEVWLGMSHDGTMVAIKSLPLPRIDITPMSDSGKNDPFAMVSSAYKKDKDAAPPVIPSAQASKIRRRMMLQRQQQARAERAQEAEKEKPKTEAPECSSTRAESANKGADGAAREADNQSAVHSPGPSASFHAAGEAAGALAISLPKSVRQAPTQTGDNALDELLREVALMVQLRHDHVVSFLGSAIEREHVLIVMEYCSGGSLQGIVARFGQLPGPSVRRFTKDILKGLEYLHSQEVIHRDLKPHNVLVHGDGLAKLADFGASAQLKGQCASGAVIGTPLYMAPEAARGHAAKPSDIWGLGIIVCQLVTGTIPWAWHCESGFNPHQFLYRLGHDASFRPRIPDDMPAEAHSFANQCLIHDPAGRPTVLKLQFHPFSIQ